jgi:group I intron endonuclease
MLVYKITNTINALVYIGITTSSLGKRKSEYKSTAKGSKKSSQRIINAMRKHGFDKFNFEILEEASDRELLKKREIEFIALYDSANREKGYNISLGGDLISEETRQKMSRTRKGKPKTEEWKKNLSDSLMGHKLSEETIKKMSDSLKGRSIWNTGTKGLVKPNSGSFSSDKPAPNKGRKRVLVEGKIKFIKAEIS